jgi:hypothetical protein
MSEETKDQEEVEDSEAKVEPQSLTDQQKKTIWEWAKYLTVELLKAIARKVLGL